jgi:gluconolactonase
VPEYTANFGWGDDDLKILFITASTSVHRIRLNTPGPAQLR